MVQIAKSVQKTNKIQFDIDKIWFDIERYKIQNWWISKKYQIKYNIENLFYDNSNENGHKLRFFKL
jgi:hypothetical protein